MQFEDFFRDATSYIVIIGTNPLAPYLERSAQFFKDLLVLNSDLRVHILCESDSENFGQSLCVDTDYSGPRASFAELTVHRDRVIGKGKQDGLRAAVRDLLLEQRVSKESLVTDSALDRLFIRQSNLRLPVNLIAADGKLWCCITTHSLPALSSYFPVDPQSRLHTQLMDFLDFYLKPDKAGIYLSEPGDELIELYDKKGYPRGIFPRGCFYTTEYERYSIWGFVFNRKGQLLLQQRGMTVVDGRGLWDKSIGGHVDLRDSSTFITAERELVEEMFLPEAEYSRYVRADLGDIIHFGEWNPKKRPERAFVQAFQGLGESDWVIFRATDDDGEPMTVTRISDRRIHGEDGGVSIKKTVFRSDVYLFIAPPGYLDTEDQMKRLLGHAEVSGAAAAHRLLRVEELRQWARDAENTGNELDTFTDDLLYVVRQHRDLLEGFSQFISYLQ
jgi:hypothetical protein